MGDAVKICRCKERNETGVRGGGGGASIKSGRKGH